MLQYIVPLDWCAAQSTDPPASLFDEPGIRSNILQMAPLNKQTSVKPHRHKQIKCDNV